MNASHRYHENFPPDTDEDLNAAYQATLMQILNRADILDARAMGEIQKLLALLQADVIARMNTEIYSRDMASNWGLWWLPQLQAAIDSAVAEIAERTGQALAGGLAASWETGAALVDGGVKVISGVVSTQPIITPLTLTILAPYSAGLVKGVNEKTRETISKSVATSIALGKSPFELMKTLHAPVAERGTPANQVAYHAERIARTELARVQDLSRQARMNQVVGEFPELRTKLKVIFISVQRGPWPCKICRPFHGQVFDVGDPKTPTVPMHPNCRCLLSPFLPGLSDPPEPIVHRKDKKSISSSATSKAALKANADKPKPFSRNLKEACCPHH